MKNEHSSHNKIIPIKSLVESSKQNNKRHYIQFASRDSHNSPGQTIGTPKGCNNQFQNMQLPYTRPENTGPRNNPVVGEKVKGMNVTGNHVNQVHFGNQKHAGVQKGFLPYEELTYSGKNENFLRQGHGSSGKTTSYKPQNNRKDSSAHVTPQKSRGDESEEKNKINIGLCQQRESFKSMTLKRGSAQFPKDTSFVSGKLEDETWNASRFENMVASDRESQPIFKNDITKIKTELFQKEAQLFELSQKLEDKQNIIKEMMKRIEMTKEMNRNLKSDISRQGDSDKLKLTNEIERLSEQVLKLTHEINSKKMKYEKEEENSSTNQKMLLLKIRQFEFEDNEKTQYIIEMKEKEKKSLENYEKIINGQKQLLRQKEQQIVKVSQAAQFYKDEVSKNIQEIEDLTRASSSKEEVIRQLSGQVSDLKSNLNELQVRMREMIEREDDFSMETENFKQSAQSGQMVLSLKLEIETKQKQVAVISEQKTVLLKKIDNLQQSLVQKIPKKANEVNEFELSMMEKTCDEYKRKIDEYHKYSEEMRRQMSDLKRSMMEKDQENLQLKTKYGQPSQKKKSSPRKSLSPIREGPIDEKEFHKLKHLNSKLFKDNEKMNAILKDQNVKIYQFYRVNKGLNETIVSNELERLNYHFSKKWAQDC